LAIESSDKPLRKAEGVYHGRISNCEVKGCAMVEVVFRDKKFQVKDNIAARDALRKLGIEPEGVLVVVNGKLTTDDVILKEGDKVKLVAVVSGGNQ
jgi:sulfur carrier protein ThiS